MKREFQGQKLLKIGEIYCPLLVNLLIRVTFDIC